MRIFFALLVLLAIGIHATSVQAQDSCRREVIIKSFTQATDLQAWAEEYMAGDCPANIKRAVNLLAAASDLIDIDYLTFAAAGDPSVLSPIWKWHPGRSTSLLYFLDTGNNKLTLLADSSTEQRDAITTAPVLAYEYTGDFEAQVKLDFSPVGTSHGAGLGIRSSTDPNTWLRLARVNDNLEFTVDTAGTSTVIQSIPYTGESAVYLQITRTGAAFAISYSINGDDWETIEEEYIFDLPDTVEIYLTSFWGETSGAGSATFSEFSIR